MTLITHTLDNPNVETYKIPGAQVFERFFKCPINHFDPTSTTIAVFVRHLVSLDKVQDMKIAPFVCYLQGGPGFECRLPASASSGWIKVFVEMGYQVLLLDQRGTGLSTPASAVSLEKLFGTDDQKKAEYLKHFRADNICRDVEFIRKQLTEGRQDQESKKITLLGQSFGGFCSITYLSLLYETPNFFGDCSSVNTILLIDLLVLYALF
jgi:hypothetical protein